MGERDRKPKYKIKPEETMKTDKSILCGGVTDNSFNGPQTIESKNLKALDTSFIYGK